MFRLRTFLLLSTAATLLASCVFGFDNEVPDGSGVVDSSDVTNGSDASGAADAGASDGTSSSDSSDEELTCAEIFACIQRLPAPVSDDELEDYADDVADCIDDGSTVGQLTFRRVENCVERNCSGEIDGDACAARQCRSEIDACLGTSTPEPAGTTCHETLRCIYECRTELCGVACVNGAENELAATMAFAIFECAAELCVGGLPFSTYSTCAYSVCSDEAADCSGADSFLP